MNPQYIAQQQFGGQNPGFPPGRPNQEFQARPISIQGGPILPTPMSNSPNQMFPAPMKSMGPPPNQYHPQDLMIGPGNAPQMPPMPKQMAPPPNQLPPQSKTMPNSMAGPLPGQMPPVSQMGAPPNRMTPPLGQSGSVSSQMGLVSSPMAPGSTQMGPGSVQMGPPGQMGPPASQMAPPSNQMGPPSRQMGPPSGQMGPTGQTALPTGQMAPPPGQMGPPSGQIGSQIGQMGPPPGQMSLQTGQMAPPPGQMGLPSGQIGSTGQIISPSGQMGPPGGHLGPSPSQMGPPSNQMGLPTGQMGPPAGQMGSPTQIGAPSSQMGAPLGQMGPPPTQMGPPTGQMGPPSTQLGPPSIQTSSAGQMGPPSIQTSSSGQMGPPTGQVGTFTGQMGPPSSQMGPPPTQMGPPTAMGLPSTQMGPPGQMPPLPQMGAQSPSQMGPGPMGLGQMPPGSTQLSQMPPMPANISSMKPPLKNYSVPTGKVPQMAPPGMNYGPPKPGQPPQKYPGMPAMQDGYNPGVNQMTNQMQSMQIGRQYPGQQKPVMNGENMPHMPPMNQGQGYTNGNRGPQAYQTMPGQQPAGIYPPQPTYQQPQQARRLDPDQMPSPVQVTQDDQRTRSGVFCTNQKGLVPPLVSTNFITQDQGNAGPRFMRSTMYNVPTTSDMMKQTAVPFGLVISPMARTLDQEYPPPIVDFGELGPVRCIRCKAYMSPFMQFIDSGRRFQCLFCKATTEVPTEYFQHLDHTGQRVDRYERPELILGSYEFVATKDYCRNNTYPKPPAIVFVIDVSYNNIKSGLVQLLCAEMKEILKHLPIDQGHEKSRMKVGFITYNNTVHFYNVKGTLAQPQMMVVGDTNEMFMPLLDGFLCEVEESEAVINSLMQQIPTMFVETRETETVLLPAIQAGLEALKASECAGKLLVFHSTLPTAEAPGRLKNRDDRKLLGTEKERTVLSPQTQAYNQLGQDCVAAGCSVDLFISNNSYIDIATIGQICRLTGGEVFKYTYFQSDVDGPRLINDIITDISRPIAFDSIMRVRTSTGVRPTDFFGHFFMSNTTDMEIAAIDCDKAVAIEIKHDDKLTEEEGVYIQVALLYTSCSGQRRLRILNLSLKTCSQMADLYRSCELDTLVNFFSKQCVYRLLENNPKAVKDSLVNRCAQILACYRKNCASPSSAGQLILPECMKLLPLYVNCLLKSDAISGGSDMTLDDRSFVMQALTIMDIPTSVVYFYPRMIPLHEIQNGTEVPEVPNAVRCTVEKMVENGVYLLENGIHMLLWIGLGANSEWIQSVFGVPAAGQVDTDCISLPELDNSLSVTVRSLIEQVRFQRHRHMRLTLVRQRDKLEAVFRHFLVEDRGSQDNTSSYVDFLCHMHKEIRQLLS